MNGSKRDYTASSDILRYMLIHRYGGVYLDGDVRILDEEKWNKFKNHNQGVLTGHQNNSELSAEKGNELFKTLLDEIIKKYQRRYTFNQKRLGYSALEGSIQRVYNSKIKKDQTDLDFWKKLNKAFWSKNTEKKPQEKSPDLNSDERRIIDEQINEMVNINQANMRDYDHVENNEIDAYYLSDYESECDSIDNKKQMFNKFLSNIRSRMIATVNTTGPDFLQNTVKEFFPKRFSSLCIDESTFHSPSGIGFYPKKSQLFAYTTGRISHGTAPSMHSLAKDSIVNHETIN